MGKFNCSSTYDHVIEVERQNREKFRYRVKYLVFSAEGRAIEHLIFHRSEILKHKIPGRREKIGYNKVKQARHCFESRTRCPMWLLNRFLDRMKEDRKALKKW